MTTILCKKLCFVQKELDQFNMQDIYKILSKTKANTGINLDDNTTALQWQCNKPNNRSSQYSMTVQKQVAISYLDFY